MEKKSIEDSPLFKHLDGVQKMVMEQGRKKCERCYGDGKVAVANGADDIDIEICDCQLEEELCKCGGNLHTVSAGDETGEICESCHRVYND